MDGGHGDAMQGGSMPATGETATYCCTPPLPAGGVSIAMQGRGRQQNDRCSCKRFDAGHGWPELQGRPDDAVSAFSPCSKYGLSSHMMVLSTSGVGAPPFRYGMTSVMQAMPGLPGGEQQPGAGQIYTTIRGDKGHIVRG